MLKRSQLVAPFDGVIVSGDLSQQLGGAVHRGQQLFEIAPLDRYRLVMQVEENDIAHVRHGQRGEVVVTALPGQAIPFSVTLVTSVAQAAEGRNAFRVEASLPERVERLRPGMEGVAKIGIGEARLVWIWTRRFTDWLRLKAWSWLGV
jgi:multidrug resistance efflux pump